MREIFLKKQNSWFDGFNDINDFWILMKKEVVMLSLNREATNFIWQNSGMKTRCVIFVATIFGFPKMNNRKKSWPNIVLEPTLILVEKFERTSLDLVWDLKALSFSVDRRREIVKIVFDFLFIDLMQKRKFQFL